MPERLVNETNLYDTEVKVNQQYSDKDDSKLADIETLLNNTMAKS